MIIEKDCTKQNVYNVNMVRGDTEAIRIKVYSGDTLIPYMEGDVVTFTVRDYSGNEDFVIQKVITTFDDPDGYCVIQIDSEDTNDLSFKPYVYDIQLDFVGGGRKTIVRPSKFEINEEVTTNV